MGRAGSPATQPSLACQRYNIGEGRGKLNSKLTSVNRLLGLLSLGAGVVFIGRLGSEASCRTVTVEIATVVHGLLKRGALPTENVVTMGGSTPVTGRLAKMFLKYRPNPSGDLLSMLLYSPDAHAVREGVGAIRWPNAAVLLEHCDIPHQLVHDLRKFDRVRGRAGAASGCTGAAVGNVILMVGAIEVLAVPASVETVSSPCPSMASEWHIECGGKR